MRVTVRITLKAYLWLLGLFLASAPAIADSKIVILDLTVREGTAANRTYAFTHPNKDLSNLLESFSSSHPNVTKTDEGRLFQALKDNAGQTETRWIISKGESFLVYALYNANSQNTPAISFKEESRSTQLENDLSTLANLVKKISGITSFSGDDLSPSTIRAYRTEYVVQRQRALLTITGTVKSIQTGATEDKTSAELAITTGPIEHLFLSADLPVLKADQLKYDSSTRTLDSKAQPSSFLVGIDYSIGDVLSSRHEAFKDGLILKAMIKASKSPLDSFGFALGYRAKDIKFLGATLDTFSPFVGYIFSLEDKAGGKQTSYRGRFQVGISFNLDKALSWIK